MGDFIKENWDWLGTLLLLLILVFVVISHQVHESIQGTYDMYDASILVSLGAFVVAVVLLIKNE